MATKSAAFKRIAKVIAGLDFCMLQTFKADGSTNTRPMSNNGKVQYDGDNWFFAARDSAKVAEIAANDRVCLTFADTEAMNFVAVYGNAEVLDDVELKRKLWQEDLAHWFEAGPDDPAVVLIRVDVYRMRTWGRIGDADVKVHRPGLTRLKRPVRLRRAGRKS